ncbi:MAG: DUF3362 domain-containing protein, partial [Candidatus Methanomethylophilus sp.]|nr:DUF3362 domain-containing protein [Methanomethylophilus sp.]
MHRKLFAFVFVAALLSSAVVVFADSDDSDATSVTTITGFVSIAGAPPPEEEHLEIYLTNATETWYTGYDPYTLEQVYCAKTPREKLAQRQYFFWYKPEERRGIEQSLRRIGRPDLIGKLYNSPITPNKYENHRAKPHT